MESCGLNVLLNEFGGPHVCPTNFAISDVCIFYLLFPDTKTSQVVGIHSQGRSGYPHCTQVIMAVDGMALQGARASTAMVLP